MTDFGSWASRLCPTAALLAAMEPASYLSFVAIVLNCRERTLYQQTRPYYDLTACMVQNAKLIPLEGNALCVEAYIEQGTRRLLLANRAECQRE